MTRPLKYDDQFKSLITDKIQDKFLYFIPTKVQSTGFYKTLNLQYSLMISSAYDIIIGVTSLVCLVKTMEDHKEDYSYVLSLIILTAGIIFGIIGFLAATNLKKQHSKTYKIWRYIVTLSFLIIQIFWGFKVLKIMTTSKPCQFLLLFFYLIINIYLCKISWSFHIRLIRGNELLIIHGKYLENMLIDEETNRREGLINTNKKTEMRVISTQ